jgi:short-subunit dehydrogenase
LVTGASSGIGRAVAAALKAEGCEVVGTSRNPEAIPPERRIPGVRYLRLELSDSRSVEELASAAGPVDILINNAGVSQIGSVEDISLDQLRYINEVNVVGTIYLTKLLIPGMRERRKGFIVNITSFAARIAIPFSTIYAVTKHAIAALSKGLRSELRPHGVRVVSVAPVHINTAIPMIQTYPDDSPYAEHSRRVKATRDKGMREAPNPDWLARKVVRILKARKPAPEYILGTSAMLYRFLLRALSEAGIQWLVRKTFRVPG